MITALYAGLLAVLLFVLSIRVIGLRGNPAFSFIARGKGDDELLQRAIRAHGNFTEYVPMMLILLAFLELSDASELKLHLLGGGFLIGACNAWDLHGVHEVQHAITGRWNCSNPVPVVSSSYCFSYGVSSVATLTLALARVPLVPIHTLPS